MHKFILLISLSAILESFFFLLHSIYLILPMLLPLLLSYLLPHYFFYRIWVHYDILLYYLIDGLDGGDL